MESAIWTPSLGRLCFAGCRFARGHRPCWRLHNSLGLGPLRRKHVVILRPISCLGPWAEAA